MASVFLSYVREDAEKARTIATLLDRAGHSVWWDRQIKGGAEYSDEIGTIPPARICIFPGRTNEYDRIVARTSSTWALR